MWAEQCVVNLCANTLAATLAAFQDRSVMSPDLFTEPEQACRTPRCDRLKDTLAETLAAFQARSVMSPNRISSQSLNKPVSRLAVTG